MLNHKLLVVLDSGANEALCGRRLYPRVHGQGLDLWYGRALCGPCREVWCLGWDRLRRDGDGDAGWSLIDNYCFDGHLKTWWHISYWNTAAGWEVCPNGSVRHRVMLVFNGVRNESGAMKTPHLCVCGFRYRFYNRSSTYSLWWQSSVQILGPLNPDACHKRITGPLNAWVRVGHLGDMKGYVVPSWGYVGPSWGLCWTILGFPIWRKMGFH